MSDYLIIGGSAGGIGAIESIREIDPIGTISLVSEETFYAYSRPMISDFVCGSIDIEKMKYRDEKFFVENDVELFINKKAIRLDPIEKFIELDDGEKIVFKKLLIATGGIPFIPKMGGLGKEGVFTFTSFSDAKKIKLKLENSTNVVVIGGGLIGISLAESLVKCGLQVYIVELKDRILSNILDKKASDIMEKIIRKMGCEIFTDKTVNRIVGKEKSEATVGGVILTNGEKISCDLVVLAIGVTPRIEFFKETGLKINRGIVVDRFMRTNFADIYACGDVAEVYDFTLNTERVLPLWPLAHLSGKIAGYNMANKKAVYPGGTNMSALKYFGIPIISVGVINTDNSTNYEIFEYYDSVKEIYKKIVVDKNIIVGMLFVNDIGKSGTIFYLIKNGVNVEDFKHMLIKEDFNLASLPVNLRKKMFLEGLGWKV